MVEFVGELPRSNTRKYDWAKITTELRDNPGQWAVVEGEGVKGTAPSAQAISRNIRNGAIKGAAKGEFEATTRGATVYARYVGESGG